MPNQHINIDTQHLESLDDAVHLALTEAVYDRARDAWKGVCQALAGDTPELHPIDIISDAMLATAGGMLHHVRSDVTKWRAIAQAADDQGNQQAEQMRAIALENRRQLSEMDGVLRSAQAEVREMAADYGVELPDGPILTGAIRRVREAVDQRVKAARTDSENVMREVRNLAAMVGVGVEGLGPTAVIAALRKAWVQRVTAQVGAQLEVESHLRLALDALTARRCRQCGCTEADCSGCVARTGEPCHWVEPDLCSACVPPVPDTQMPLPFADFRPDSVFMAEVDPGAVAAGMTWNESPKEEAPRRKAVFDGPSDEDRAGAVPSRGVFAVDASVAEAVEARLARGVKDMLRAARGTPLEVRSEDMARELGRQLQASYDEWAEHAGEYEGQDLLDRGTRE